MSEGKTTNWLRLHTIAGAFFLLLWVIFGGVGRTEQDDPRLDHWKVQMAVDGLARAWNRAGAPALARFFTEEALLITPLGGGSTRQEIPAFQHAARWRGTRFSSKAAVIDFPTANIGVVEGTYRIAGVQLGAGARRTVEGPFVFRLERNGSEWKISRARFYRSTEKHLAHRDAHNERYPFVEMAEDAALVIPSSGEVVEGKLSAPRPAIRAGEVVAGERIAVVGEGWR
jgi:hypothetical protein